MVKHCRLLLQMIVSDYLSAMRGAGAAGDESGGWSSAQDHGRNQQLMVGFDQGVKSKKTVSMDCG